MPPPPPPSASYNLKLDDFSDSEEEDNNDYYSSHQQAAPLLSTAAAAGSASSSVVHKTDGYLVQDAAVVSLTELRQKYADGKVSKEEFAAALRAHQATTTANTAVKSDGRNTANENQRRMMMVDGEEEPEVVEAINVKVLSDDSDIDDEDCQDNDNGDSNISKMDVDGQSTVVVDGEVSSPVRKKKKKKKKVSSSSLIYFIRILYIYIYNVGCTSVSLILGRYAIVSTIVQNDFTQKKKKKSNANNLDDGAALANDSNENGNIDQNDMIETSINDDNNNNVDNADGKSTVLEDNSMSIQSTPTKKSSSSSSSSKSISFGTISVREYARTIGTHVVPADGGYPLGLSTTIVTEHNNTMDVESGQVISTTSSPMKEAVDNATLSSLSSSPSNNKHHHHHHRHHDYHGWKIDDFESRKQVELQQRYTQLIHEQRKRNFEKAWEKKHHSQLHSKHHHSYNTRNKGGGGRRERSGSFGGSSSSKGGGGGRQRSGSFSGGGGGGNSGGKNRKGSSGYCKMEMSDAEKQELEQLLAQPVHVPDGVLETRPYDYKKKLPGGSSSSSSSKVKRDDLTEEEELLYNHRGRNPLFGVIKEDERRRILQRDDHLLKFAEEVAAAAASSTTKRSAGHIMQEDDDDDVTNHLDPVFTQHVQHDLESLRIERSDPTNLGCDCRKLNVFLPGEADKSNHKKKKSHRRMNERKVREELRKRGLLHKGNSDMSREKMEKMLHDAIETQPCCWGIDCPCVRSGVGCQADTCSCWHASHDVPHTTPTTKKETDSDPKKVGESDVEAIERKCGNTNGMYVVNMKKIKEYRQQYVATQSEG